MQLCTRRRSYADLLQKSNETNLLSHLKVELDGAKIKHHQAKKQIADLITVRSDKEKIIKSLENKLLTGDGSALNYVNDHNSLKACLRSISEEILHERQRRQSSVTEEEVLHSLEKKVKMMKQAMYQKKKTYDKELGRLKREYATLMKVRHSFSINFLEAVTLH